MKQSSMPTLWQKLNKSSNPRRCSNMECRDNAMFRTKRNNNGKLGEKDLTEYYYACPIHTYL
jgi:hypothetical protein